MLKVQNLHQYYGGSHILRDVNFTAEIGKVTVLLGRNGVGKTTLLKSLMGLVPIRSGGIEWQGRDIARRTPYERARSGIGYVPQGRRIFPLLSVRDNLVFAASVHHGREAQRVVEEVLADFPALPRLLDRAGGLLSGGEQQILALARCLCTRPRLVLLDEPTEGIQPSIIEDMVVLLRALRTRHRLSIVLVEQNLDFLRALSERIVVLEKGRIVREAHAQDTAAMAALVESAEFAG